MEMLYVIVWLVSMGIYCKLTLENYRKGERLQEGTQGLSAEEKRPA